MEKKKTYFKAYQIIEKLQRIFVSWKYWNYVRAQNKLNTCIDIIL